MSWGEDQNNQRSSAESQRQSAANKGRRGGARPGAGAPKGNLNALKHGRYSRRQRELLDYLMENPQTREALIAIGKRNRQRRKDAEEGFGVLLTRLLERAARVYDQSNNQPHNDQEFLDFLNDATAQMRLILEKRPPRKRRSIKRDST